MVTLMGTAEDITRFLNPLTQHTNHGPSLLNWVRNHIIIYADLMILMDARVVVQQIIVTQMENAAVQVWIAGMTRTDGNAVMMALSDVSIKNDENI